VSAAAKDPDQAAYEQDHINKMIEDTERAAPMFVYELADYDGERLVSFAPIQTGDFVSVRLSDDTFLRERKVKRVIHREHVVNVGKQILNPSLELE